MHRGFQRALGLVFVSVLTQAAGEARAQYYPGYGGWGWGGWGGAGSTVQGSIAQGLGYYLQGAGAYNQETAAANSINADTIMRWNEFWYLSQQEANRREYLRRQRMAKRDADSMETIYKRARENPTDHDIEDGDALNAILDQLTHPRVHSTALRLIKTPIDAKAIRDIPFENASEAATISLGQLTGEEAWPVALQAATFAPERKAYQDAVAKAIKEDEEGTLTPETIKAVQQAAFRLRAKLEANKPGDPAEYRDAINYIRGLVGMARLLEKPQIDKIIADLDKVKETSLGSLLGFMHTYNLRFGPANTPEQRAVYSNLYPLMDEARDRVLKEAGENNPPPSIARNSHRPAIDFFQGMKLEDLQPSSNGNQNRP